MKRGASNFRTAAAFVLGLIHLVGAFRAGAQETNPTSAPQVPEVSPTAPAQGENAPTRQTNETAAVSPPTKDAQTNSAAAGKSGATPPALTFDSFRLIAERNIFDQSREPRSTRSARASRASEARRAPRVESFALVGTMSYSKGTFAFFDGNSSQYKKTLKVGDTIGAYRLTDVTQNHVKLTGEKQELDLKVGQHLRREDEGEWQVSTRTAESAPANSPGGNAGAESRGSAPDSSGPASSGTPASSDASEALKRLLQKREKELSQ